MPNCPNCSKPMAPGFLGSGGMFEGSKWFLERTRLAFGGDEVAKPNAFGMVYIPGFRCRECRMMLLQVPERRGPRYGLSRELQGGGGSPICSTKDCPFTAASPRK